MAFDEARFRQVQPQLAAYARGYVPTLLRRTGMDVRSVLEFGYAYNVDGALALVAPGRAARSSLCPCSNATVPILPCAHQPTWC